MWTAHHLHQRSIIAMEGLEGKCGWCLGSELYERYHDQEWGKPLRDEQQMFRAGIFDRIQRARLRVEAEVLRL